MGDILREVRVRESVYQDRDIKVIIEKSDFLRTVYAIPWGKVEKSWSTWVPIEFDVNELTEENNFGDYSKFYAEYIKERDQPINIFGGYTLDFHQRNNLEFSSEWNTDLDIIKLYILINTEKYKSDVYQWNLIEDPIKGDKGGIAPYYRSFGFEPYYLNNGVEIRIEWGGNIGEMWSDDRGRELDVPNPKFYNGAKKMSKGNKKVSGIYLPDDVVDPNLDNKFIYYKYGLIYTNKDGKSISSFAPLRNDPGVSKASLDGYENYGGQIDDEYIIREIIREWKANVEGGYDELDLVRNEIGSPVIYLGDAVDYKKIEYKSPFGIDVVENNISPTSSVVDPVTIEPPIKASFKPTFFGIEDGIQILAKNDLPSFTVFVGDPDKDWTNVGVGDLPQGGENFDNVDGSELWDEDNEYLESDTIAEEEAPPEIREYVPPSIFISDDENIDPVSTNASSVWVPGPKVGNIVELPSDYSHNKTQGYNILNGQWIGDLIASAKSHINHPTWDIPGTEKGSLGCASAVSIIFYRAFGVHMKTGKPLKTDKPGDISNFGSKGTYQLAGWFKGNSIYQQISWRDAKPGDIINTSRNFSTGKAGHIGIVIDEKHRNGSWIIISNSSKGFAGGGGGAILKNYSIKAWEKVATRNPSETFAYRYVGPVESPVV